MILGSEINSIQSEINTFNERITNKKIKIDENTQKIENTNKEICNVEQDIKDNELVEEKDSTELRETSKKIEIEEKNIDQDLYKLDIKYEQFKKFDEQKKQKEKELSFLESERNDWKEIAQAYNQKTGIPILKLEETLPIIENNTNLVLKDVSNFRVSFNTKKIDNKKKASKKKNDDDDISFTFEITVEKGKEEPLNLKMLSGGQIALVEAAIALGSIIYLQNTNKYKLSVMFLDECDGPLSELSIEKFYKMIQRAHKESGCKQTIFITHRVGAIPEGISKIHMGREYPGGFKVEKG